ncbi:MAG TPA: hypothetical protein VHG30_12625 [Microvirga sp.]|nr:hypothetical protein [Microvirga sp.]
MHVRVGSRLAAALAAFGLTGCSAAYILAEYSAAPAANVTTACGRGYTVSNAKDERLLVTAYPLVELLFCDAPQPGGTGVRYERAAVAYLEQFKPQCRVASGREVDPLHSEFTLHCPPAATAAPAAKPTHRKL